jgi:hypothetical protein
MNAERYIELNLKRTKKDNKIIVRCQHQKIANVSLSNPDPSYSPQRMKVDQLRAVLAEKNVPLPSENMPKSFYVDLFNEKYSALTQTQSKP